MRALAFAALLFGLSVTPVLATPLTITQELSFDSGRGATTSGGSVQEEKTISATFQQFDGTLGELLGVEISLLAILGDDPLFGGGVEYSLSRGGQVLAFSSLFLRTSFGAVSVDESLG